MNGLLMHCASCASIAILILTGVCASAMAIEPTHRDVEYATVDDRPLSLDLYLPGEASQKPLVVWVHGGAWRAGSKASVPIDRLVNRGFPIASVDYRLSPVAKFPAQVHDIKAAIRFLRSQANAYQFDARRIAIAGASAGGHLAALVGVSNGVPELEGAVGTHRTESSDVQAIVSFYGASNLESILSQSTPHGLSVRVPALKLLLGGRPEDNQRLAKLASPVTHVDSSDPPLLLIHGDQDPQMPINQAHELHGKYLGINLPSHLEVIYGAAHGGKRFYDDVRLPQIARFLDGSRHKDDGPPRKFR